ncbi:MAG: hypothetical protein K0S47_4119 [Herbinix sp.]|jgi:hypothetical protein|nr:hypothetical protein [Herbinix sp.]
MFCSKCGKEFVDGSKFCSICGNCIPTVSSIQPLAKKKRGKLWFVVFSCVTIIFLGIIVFSGDDSADNTYLDDNTMNESSNAQVSDDANTFLENTLLLAKESTSATCELVRDSSQIVSFSSEAYSILMELMEPENYSATEYAYLFNPEYRIIMDSGVSFNIMQDLTTSAAILRFDGDDTLYTANYDLFKVSNLVPTEEVDDYSYLHHFTDGTNRDNAIDACIQSSAIFRTAYSYAAANGFDINHSAVPCYRVDDYDVVPLDDVNPNLVAVYISFSIVPYSMDGIENSQVFFENEGWISGGTLYGAFYIDERTEGTRVYPIGIKGMVLDINETSIFEEATKFYESSQVKNLFE